MKDTTTVSGATTITHYFGVSPAGVNFEFVDGPTQDTWNDYLYAGGEMVGVQKRIDGDAVQSTRYFVKDHLGSIAVLTTETGVVAERLAFDAWGKRRNANGSDDIPGTLASQTTRGFTGHEMIDEFDLVNMNGRIYDPLIGRFLSADPMIHDATNGQDLNRYSYVHNNPLSYTDMNGYGFFKSIGKFFKKFWKPLLAIVVAIVAIHLGPLLFGEVAGAPLVGAASPLTLGQSAIISGISGGLSNVVLTGKPKAFLSGFGQAFATFAVGHILFPGSELTGAADFGSRDHIGRVIGHGVVGCGFAEVRGDKCTSGFAAAAFSAAAGPLGPRDFWGGFAFASALGGAGAVLGGGKFANGVVTSAFTYLFNAAAGELRQKGRKICCYTGEGALEQAESEMRRLLRTYSEGFDERMIWGSYVYETTQNGQVAYGVRIPFLVGVDNTYSRAPRIYPNGPLDTRGATIPKDNGVIFGFGSPRDFVWDTPGAIQQGWAEYLGACTIVLQSKNGGSETRIC